MSGRAKEAPVQVGGRLRHLVVDTNAFCIVEEQTGVNLVEGIDNPPLRVLRALCYGALRSGCRKNRTEPDFTLEDVGDWMQETPELLKTVEDLLRPALPQPAAGGPQMVQGESVGASA